MLQFLTSWQVLLVVAWLLVTIALLIALFSSRTY